MTKKISTTTQTEQKRKTSNPCKEVTPYRVGPNTLPINIYKEPDLKSEIICPVTGGTYTIVAETDKGEGIWGKLASGVGWIQLDRCSKIE